MPKNELVTALQELAKVFDLQILTEAHQKPELNTSGFFVSQTDDVVSIALNYQYEMPLASAAHDPGQILFQRIRFALTPYIVEVLHQNNIATHSVSDFSGQGLMSKSFKFTVPENQAGLLKAFTPEKSKAEENATFAIRFANRIHYAIEKSGEVIGEVTQTTIEPSLRLVNGAPSIGINIITCHPELSAVLNNQGLAKARLADTEEIRAISKASGEVKVFTIDTEAGLNALCSAIREYSTPHSHVAIELRTLEIKAERLTLLANIQAGGGAAALPRSPLTPAVA